MSLSEIYRQFITGIQQTGGIEFVAVASGIASVWLEQKANIWLYPVGIISTILYVYISLKGHLPGEASVNIFYTIMGIYGWILWAKKDDTNKTVLHIRYSSIKEWTLHLVFFGVLYIIIYFALSNLKKEFPGAIPAADAFASATAYTAMLLMARKKVESWIWWIITNIASIPLYFIKGYVFTSFQFVVLLMMAFVGLVSWQKKAKYARD